MTFTEYNRLLCKNWFMVNEFRLLGNEMVIKEVYSLVKKVVDATLEEDRSFKYDLPQLRLLVAERVRIGLKEFRFERRGPISSLIKGSLDEDLKKRLRDAVYKSLLRVKLRKGLRGRSPEFLWDYHVRITVERDPVFVLNKLVEVCANSAEWFECVEPFFEIFSKERIKFFSALVQRNGAEGIILCDRNGKRKSDCD